MTIRISTSEAKAKLSEILDRTIQHGERFVVERNGKPVAAVVSLSDLERLESSDQTPLPITAEQRQLMQGTADRLGIVIHWPSGTPTPWDERPLIKVKGRPISEDIIADRR